MLGVYNYTVILTYMGMLSAYAGIILAIQKHPVIALICLLFAGACDMFDGKVASMKKDRTAKEKRFGIQIDSLSDLICFGVLPAVVVSTLSGGRHGAYYIAGLYVLCALIRLAWFNVDEEERQEETDDVRKTYQGLPVTSAALIVPAWLGISSWCGLPLPVMGPVCLLLMAIAFITPFKLRKPGDVGKLVLLILGVVLAAAILLVKYL